MYIEDVEYDGLNQEEAWEKLSKAIADFFVNYKEYLKKMPKHLSDTDLMDEAVLRMKELEFSAEDIDKFKKEGKISYVMEGGSKHPINALDQKQIQGLSKKGFLVYAAVRQLTMFGKMTAYILVSNHTEDWAFERENLQSNTLLSYVYNHDVPKFSELGNIVVKRLPKGLLERVF